MDGEMEIIPLEHREVQHLQSITQRRTSACVDMGAYGKPPENLQEEQACFLAQLPSPNASTSCFALSGSSVTLASSSQHRPTK